MGLKFVWLRAECRADCPGIIRNPLVFCGSAGSGHFNQPAVLDLVSDHAQETRSTHEGIGRPESRLREVTDISIGMVVHPGRIEGRMSGSGLYLSR